MAHGELDQPKDLCYSTPNQGSCQTRRTGKEHVERFITTETLVIELLLIVSLVAIAVRRLRIPYVGGF